MSELADLIGLAADDMVTSLARTRTALSHGLSKGEANEAVVRAFLRDRLPSFLEVGRGQIVDRYGNKSRQLDVVIFDSARTPVLWIDHEDDQRLFPSEGVLAVVEVKTSLSGSDAPQVVENMKSVKRLDKSAFYSSTGAITTTKSIYGATYELAPTLFFVFAFEGVALDGVRTAMASEMAGCGLAERVDCGVVLSQGVLLWQDPVSEMVDAVPGGPDWIFGSLDSDHALLLFYVLIARYLFQLRGGLVDLHKYLPPDMKF